MSHEAPIGLLPSSKTDIVSQPDVMGGEPVVRGTRVPAVTIAAYIKAGRSDREIFDDFPSLPADGVDAVRRWQMVIPSP